MAWTKRQLVEEAFTEVGYASYVFDLQAEQIQMALRRLDGMLAQWNASGLRLSYPLPGAPGQSDLDQSSNLPDAADEAVYLNLAIRIAPSLGKVVSVDTKMNAKAAHDRLMALAAQPGEMQMPRTMPAGAGQKRWRYNDDPFVRRPIEPLLAGPDGPIEFT